MDKNNIVPMFERFDSYQYPDNEQIISGLKIGDGFEYVSTRYLNGLINYVDIKAVFMVNRYSDNDRWKNACKYIDEELSGFHTDFGKIPNSDDIIILGKLSDSWMIFYSDMDCSDSMVARIKIEDGETLDDAIDSLKLSMDYVLEYTIRDDITDRIKEIPLSKVKGWISL